LSEFLFDFQYDELQGRPNGFTDERRLSANASEAA
jgi:hypothetical protein